MPVFHTKTIESILEPVAQQVSRLVILHEEAEDGNAMPDLERPVQAVSRAVANLVKVGRETINSSEDAILKQDMPSALLRVEGASKLLEEASGMLNIDPYSGPARKKLIEGSRGILQGTSALLLCFDESEVRKIIRECKKVLDYLAVTEVIETMEDLAQFLKDLSPCLSKVSWEVGIREKELTHQVHREILVKCMDQIKSFAPILICSMKMFIYIIHKTGQDMDEVAENRNYLASRMSDEINEIIRVLQLTTYDEDEWDADNLTVMKKTLNAMQSKVRPAKDWLEETGAVRGGVGERAVRSVADGGRLLASRALASDRESLARLASDIDSMTDALCELRLDNPTSPQVESMGRSVGEKVVELVEVGGRAVGRSERAGGEQPAHTLAGRMEQALRWLQQPAAVHTANIGQTATDLIVQFGRKVAEGLTGAVRAEMLVLCDEVDRLSRQLSQLASRGMANSPQAQEIARTLSDKLHRLKEMIQTAVVNRVVEDLVDISTPLKNFTAAVETPEDIVVREAVLEDKGRELVDWAERAADTGRLVAGIGGGGNKRLVESLGEASGRVESLAPQVVAAGRVKMHYPVARGSQENFINLSQQYTNFVHRVRDLCHHALDAALFVALSEEQMEKEISLAEEALSRRDTESLVEHTSRLARLGNRVLQVARQEAENSEDPRFIASVSSAADRLHPAVTKAVQDAKHVALYWKPAAIASWKTTNKDLMAAVRRVRLALSSHLPNLNNLHINEPKYEPPVIKQPYTKESDMSPPPRPPLPGGEVPPPRPPPPPETDDEDDMFRHAPQPNQPIMMAAHGLHEEVRQWSSKDNEIIAAAKRMAVLMGRLSQLVRGEGGTKRDLIACAKAIAEASGDVTRLANELARECTDKRMRTNLLQVCERIPTIGTQLKILSTVKATMLGAQEILPRREFAELQGGSDEDQEATDMLVGNAQNLMQSVKETVRAAEAASIKIRTDAGIRLRWVRRQPWYQY